MINVSQEFLDIVRSDAKKWYAKIVVNYTDVFLDTTISASSTNNARISYPSQAVNGRTDMTQKWLSLDEAFTLGDGLHPCPDDGTESFNELGWWSQDLSGTGGVFVSPPELTIEYSLRAVSGFYIVGDNKRNEWAADFTVKLYNNTTLLHTETTTGNTDVKRTVSFAQVNNVNRVVLTVNKWSHAGRNAKLAEFTTQVIEEYTGESICGFNIIEEREISVDNSIPVGNIAASESNICLSNDGSRPFDFNNTASRLFGLVKPNVKVEIYVGLMTSAGIEYIPMHKGWSMGWSVPENDITANVTVRDRLNLLTQTKINTSVIQNETFYQWYERVLNDAGIANTEYEIDTFFNAHTVPYGWFDNISHREALRELAEGSSAVVFEDRYGKIIIKPLTSFDTTVQETYTRSDYSVKNNMPQYESVANRINVTTSPIVKTTGQSIYSTIEPEEVAGSSTETIEIFYTDKPVSDQSASISPPVSGISILTQTHYAWGSILEVQNTNPTTTQFNISVTGSTYKVAGQKRVTRSDSASIEDNGEITFNYPTNHFLQKKDLASIIATNLLSSFKDPQKDLEVGLERAGNPALELGDRVTITDLYGSKNYNLVSTSIDFDGGMNINHRGRT